MVLLGSSLGGLGGSLGGLGSDFGSILGVFLMDSGAFFGSQARPIMKRCFLGSQSFVFLLDLAEIAEIAPTRKKPMNLQLFRVMLEASVSLLLSLFSHVCS